MQEFADRVVELADRRPDPEEDNDSRKKWKEIENRLRDGVSCTGLCLRWKVLHAVSIPLPGKFPQLGWCRLREANYGMISG